MLNVWEFFKKRINFKNVLFIIYKINNDKVNNIKRQKLINSHTARIIFCDIVMVHIHKFLILNYSKKN